MTATGPEIGTNSAATLYAQGESIRETVEKHTAVLADIAQSLRAIQSTLASREQFFIDIANNQSNTAVDVSNIGDRIIEIQTYQQAANAVLDTISKVTTETRAKTILIDTSLNAFVGWFSPLLNDFHDSSIVPTLNKLLGKVDALAESHTNILTVVQAGKAQIDPLITKLQESPILRMLGVKND
jgi:uncharacterized membrane protein